MAIENVQQLLTEQLGKNRCDVIATTAMTSKDYYCIHFPVESVIASIVATNATTAVGSAILLLMKQVLKRGIKIGQESLHQVGFPLLLLIGQIVRQIVMI